MLLYNWHALYSLSRRWTPTANTAAIPQSGSRRRSGDFPEREEAEGPRWLSASQSRHQKMVYNLDNGVLVLIVIEIGPRGSLYD